MLAKWAIKKPSLMASLDSDLIVPMVAVYAQLERASLSTCTQMFKLVFSFSQGVFCWQPGFHIQTLISTGIGSENQVFHLLGYLRGQVIALWVFKYSIQILICNTATIKEREKKTYPRVACHLVIRLCSNRWNISGLWFFRTTASFWIVPQLVIKRWKKLI